MRISENGLNLIKSFEGCRLAAYKCPAGIWTIGWGHTGDVKPGETITQEQADRLLVEDMVAYENKVDKYDAIYHWNQNEFDALVSFAYNVGSIDQLTAKGIRSREVIASKMLEYNKAGGNVLSGLTRRREAERALFLTPMIENVAGWNQTQYGWWYQNEDGTYPVNCWQQIDSKRYWFNEDGYAYQSQWLEYKGKWYYLDDTCAMVKGPYIIDGHLYLFDDSGEMMTGTQTLILTTDRKGALL